MTLRAAALRATAILLVLGAGVIALRIAALLAETRASAAFVERRAGALSGPGGPVTTAGADACGMFRRIARDHFQARDLAVARQPGWRGLFDPLAPRNLRRMFPQISTRQAAELAAATWDTRSDYKVACDWGNSGLIDQPPALATPAGGRPFPVIAFGMPLRTKDGLFSLVRAHRIAGNIGIEGYQCLLQNTAGGWRLLECRLTLIS